MACFQAQAKMWELIPMAAVFVFPLFVIAKCFNSLLHKRTCTHFLHQGVNTCTHLLYRGVSESKTWAQTLMSGYRRWMQVFHKEMGHTWIQGMRTCTQVQAGWVSPPPPMSTPEAIFRRRIFSSVSPPPLDTGCEHFHLSMTNSLQSFSFPTASSLQEVERYSFAYGRIWHPHHRTCIHRVTKVLFVGPRRLPKLWGKKLKATTRVADEPPMRH